MGFLFFAFLFDPISFRFRSMPVCYVFFFSIDTVELPQEIKTKRKKLKVMDERCLMSTRRRLLAARRRNSDGKAKEYTSGLTRKPVFATVKIRKQTVK